MANPLPTSIALLLAAVSILHAAQPSGHAEFQSCRAEWTATELVLANSHFERKWRIQNGLLTATSFRDLGSSVEWVAKPANRPAPLQPALDPKFPRTLTISARTARANAVEAESLLVEAKTEGTPAATYTFKVFPEAHGVSIEFQVAGAPSTDNRTAPKPSATVTASGVETTPAAGPEKDDGDSLEDLLLAPQHLRFTQVELLDQTDIHNELVFEHEWLLAPNEGPIKRPGNVFFVEDVLTGAGLIFLKQAPLPHARPINSEWDAQMTASTRRLRFAGQRYPFALLAYKGGRFGRVEALQTYQRCLRSYDPKRDGKFLSNTWGDRSRDARINEAFMVKEIEAGARLGVDVVQIDDGWQKGRTANSAAGKGAWNGYWAADPNFWHPHPQRLPGGLAPLVKAAREKGMKFGLWFGPDTSAEGANWQRDADRLIDLHRQDGIDYFKLDSVKAVNTRIEENFQRFLARVLDQSQGQVVFDLDVTAEIRPGYFGAPHVGPIFVENRYTDWHRYWPHQTLRNLWKLAQYVDPMRLRMEFLNNARQTNQYPNDPLAPARYAPDTLFATVMFANPLGWFEASNLPEDYVRSVSQLTAIWKRERDAMFSGRTFPIGAAPDGVSWTGFASVTADHNAAYVLLFRELNASPSASIEIPVLSKTPHRVTTLAGTGSAVLNGTSLTATVSEPLGYVWVKITP